MTPIEIVALAGALLQGVLIPAAIWFWRVYRLRVKDSETRQFIDDAVTAAEELGAAGKWDAAKKRAYVLDAVAKKYPKIAENKELLDMLIHSALQMAGLGASSPAKPAGEQ